MARPRPMRKCCSAACRREIQPWEKGIAIALFGRTFGMGKQRTSKSQRLYLCPRCSIRTIVGKIPTENTPVDLAFFKVILDLAGSEFDVTQALGEQLQKMREEFLYPPALPVGEILPPTKELKAAG